MNHTHFVRKCSCGEIIAQCRCMDKNKEEVVIQNGCSKCAEAAPAPTGLPSNSNDLVMLFVREDDENLEIKINNKTVGNFSHDSDGWRGMEQAEALARGIAEAIGIKVEEA